MKIIYEVPTTVRMHQCLVYRGCCHTARICRCIFQTRYIRGKIERAALTNNTIKKRSADGPGRKFVFAFSKTGNEHGRDTFLRKLESISKSVHFFFFFFFFSRSSFSCFFPVSLSLFSFFPFFVILADRLLALIDCDEWPVLRGRFPVSAGVYTHFEHIRRNEQQFNQSYMEGCTLSLYTSFYKTVMVWFILRVNRVTSSTLTLQKYVSSKNMARRIGRMSSFSSLEVLATK